ncbi:hypothetical protein QBC32DRAFT_214710 [Pseudoneurospora amorphoporcata]|uniref:Uncharacterized protein n=1 Tax=Pseudoneurospora amorphoporcata TaxID=241081 RepID=A0AAN6SFS1_9PEZI|nr:hypothetical protein QBC32DRAFT_214710 [Pseudoneurospora amorphoporcata]
MRDPSILKQACPWVSRVSSQKADQPSLLPALSATWKASSMNADSMVVIEFPGSQSDNPPRPLAYAWLLVSALLLGDTVTLVRIRDTTPLRTWPRDRSILIQTLRLTQGLASPFPRRVWHLLHSAFLRRPPPALTGLSFPVVGPRMRVGGGDDSEDSEKQLSREATRSCPGSLLFLSFFLLFFYFNFFSQKPRCVPMKPSKSPQRYNGW